MIEIKNLTKSYGENVVYNNFNLKIKKGEILAILGESGSGKTTLVKALANLIDYKGEIVGVEGVSMVFQKDRLCKNLTVEENVKLVCPDIDVKTALESVNLKGVEKDYIKTLSGGMARRVALVRGLYYQAPLLILDEPFINLDLALKFSLIDMIKERQAKTGQTVLVVTHDIKEAITIANRVIVIQKGRIIFDEKVNEKTENELFSVMTKKY